MGYKLRKWRRYAYSCIQSIIEYSIKKENIVRIGEIQYFVSALYRCEVNKFVIAEKLDDEFSADVNKASAMFNYFADKEICPRTLYAPFSKR